MKTCSKCNSEMIFKYETLFDGLDFMNGYFDCLTCGGKEYTEVFGIFDSLEPARTNAFLVRVEGGLNV